MAIDYLAAALGSIGARQAARGCDRKPLRTEGNAQRSGLPGPRAKEWATRVPSIFRDGRSAAPDTGANRVEHVRAAHRGSAKLTMKHGYARSRSAPCGGYPGAIGCAPRVWRFGRSPASRNRPTMKRTRVRRPAQSFSRARPLRTPGPPRHRPRVVTRATLAILRSIRRGGRAAEGARLESVYTGNRIEGSNPSPSASCIGVK